MIPVIASVIALPSSAWPRSSGWPASVTCAPGESPASSRSETAPVTWSPTVRPKRASHIACRWSSFVMSPCVSLVFRYAPRGFESRNRKCSVPSSSASSVIGTDTVFAVSRGAKVSVPVTCV